MKDIVIFGAGGFGREVQWLLERINGQKETWNILGYIDDSIKKGTLIDDYPVLGGTQFLKEYESKLSVICAIGNAAIRKKIVESIRDNRSLEYPNLIDPSVLISKRVTLGEGNIICAGNILTIDIIVGDFNIVNLDCTIGHDVKIDSFVTIYPSVNISGCVKIDSLSEIGTGTQIIQGKNICSNVVIGAGSVVARDITEKGVHVGVPVRRIK